MKAVPYQGKYSVAVKEVEDPRIQDKAFGQPAFNGNDSRNGEL